MRWKLRSTTRRRREPTDNYLPMSTDLRPITESSPVSAPHLAIPTLEQLRDRNPSKPLPTAAFAPSENAKPVNDALAGTLRFSPSPVTLSGAVVEPVQLGKRVDQFPALELPFVIENGVFMPASRQIHQGVDGRSFWQLIPGPGRVWQEPADSGSYRVGFVFTLGNNIDHLSYHGLGLLIFGSDRSSAGLRYQATQGGVPIVLPFGLEIWGYAPCEWSQQPTPAGTTTSAPYRNERTNLRRLRPWNDLAEHCPDDLLAAVCDGYGAQSAVTCALATSSDIFATPYYTVNGEHPNLATLRQGIWSATKSAGAGLALFHLAERYGPEVFDVRVADLLEVTAEHDGWSEVCLRDCFNMASGIGDLAPEAEPPGIFADYDMFWDTDSVPVQRYLRWFAAPSRAERLEAAFSHDSYPWGPGQVARYRDQDFFVLAAAMDALVKEREGTNAGLWPLIEQDVYGPIGVTHAVVNRTVEPDGSPGMPLLGGGLFLTLEEVACIAALYQALGEHAGEQLLHRASVVEATDPHTAKGLPTGLHNADGQIRYHMGFWHRPYRTRDGKLRYLPTMFGYGGTEIVLLPNSMTAIRFGHDDPRDDTSYDVTPLVRVAEQLSAF